MYYSLYITLWVLFIFIQKYICLKEKVEKRKIAITSVKPVRCEKRARQLLSAMRNFKMWSSSKFNFWSITCGRCNATFQISKELVTGIQTGSWADHDWPRRFYLKWKNRSDLPKSSASETLSNLRIKLRNLLTT